MADTDISEETPAAAPVPTHDTPAYVDWPAILAGALVASAIAFVLTAFGSGVGLSVTSLVKGEGVTATFLLIAVGIWVVWVAASSFMAGGYLAGRLRRRVPDASEHEVDIRDGCAGLIVWGLGVLIGAALLVGGIQTTVRTAGSAATAAAQTAAKTAGPGLDYVAAALLRNPAEPGSTGNADAARSVKAVLEEARRNEASVSADDRTYLAAIVADQAKLSPQDARARVDAVAKRLDDARQATVEAAETARKLSVLAAFLLAASLLIGAAGAWFGAQMGGRHRDEQTVFAFFVGRWR